MGPGRTRRKRHRRKARPPAGQGLQDEAYVCFVQWLRARGLPRHPIVCAHFADTGRGAAANRNIRGGELVASVPRALLLSTETVWRTALGPRLASHPVLLPAVQWLCAFLLWQRALGPASPYQPYLALLPGRYSTALYFTEEEVDTLPQPCKDKAQASRRDMQTSYKELAAFMQGHTDLFGACTSMDDFRWALSAVNTRCVYVDVRGSFGFAAPVRGPDHCVLAPFLDMLNHHAAAKVTAGFNEASGHFEISTSQPCRRGDQVFIHYGPHDNSTLLLEYGFVLPANPHNVASLDATVDAWLQDMAAAAAAGGRVRRQAERQWPGVLDQWALRLRVLADSGLLAGRVCSGEGPSWALGATACVLAMEPGALRQAGSHIYTPSYRPPGMAALLAHWCTCWLRTVPADVGPGGTAHQQMIGQLWQEMAAAVRATLATVQLLPQARYKPQGRGAGTCLT